MKKVMAKMVSLILSVALIVTLVPLSVSAKKVGDVIGKSQPTDIIATINGYRIESYNVDGYTYICVEDLRYYGFDVHYSNSTRTLSFKRSGSMVINPEKNNPKFYSIGNVNTRKNLIYTDIVTYAGDTYTHAYNIDGQTIINFNALSQFGSVNYDNSKREISLSLSGVNKNTGLARPESGTSYYDYLKSFIVLNGELDEDNEYTVFDEHYDSDLRCLATYYVDDKDITISVINVGEAPKSNLMLTFTKGEKPSFYYLFQYEDGDYDDMCGEFPDAYSTYRILTNTFHSSMLSAVDNSISCNLECIELFTKETFGLSLSDLGIFYIPYKG